MKFLSDAAWHFTVRAISAAFSFGLFALIARNCTDNTAVAIYYFSFVFGFLIATLRSLHALSANLHADQSHSRRLRNSMQAAFDIFWLTPLSVAAALALFLAHPITWPLAVCATIIVSICSLDSDLARASIGIGPSTPTLIAAGGAISVTYFLTLEAPTVDQGAAAFLLQWLPLAVYNLRLWLPLAMRRIHRMTRPGTASSLKLCSKVIVAAYDGAIINAPFLLSLTLVGEGAKNLSVGVRVFVASLLLYPLITHWSQSGRLRSSTSQPFSDFRVFFLMQLFAGITVGCLFSFAFSSLSGQRVSDASKITFALLLMAYSVHASVARFFSHRLQVMHQTLLYGSPLLIFYGYLLASSVRAHTFSPLFLILLQVSTLMLPALVAIAARPASFLWSTNRGH